MGDPDERAHQPRQFRRAACGCGRQACRDQYVYNVGGPECERQHSCAGAAHCSAAKRYPVPQGGARFCGRAAGCTGCGGGAGRVCGAAFAAAPPGSGVREAHAGKGCSAACVFGRRRTDGQAPGNAGGAGAGATAGFDAGRLAGAASGKYPCAERYAGAEACARRGQKARRLRVRRVFRTGMLQRKRGYGRCSLFSGGRAVCAYRGPRPAGRDRACGRRGAGV